MKNNNPGVIKVERIENHTYRTTVFIDPGNPDDRMCNFTISSEKTDWSGQFNPIEHEEIILRQAKMAIDMRLHELDKGEEFTD